jgi:hypothetical protein
MYNILYIIVFTLQIFLGYLHKKYWFVICPIMSLSALFHLGYSICGNPIFFLVELEFELKVS